MKITKYPQSCLVVEAGGGRVLIDPGTFAVDAYSLDDFGPLNAVLYTHRHVDHYDERLIEPLRERRIAMYGNDDVADVIGEGCNSVTEGAEFTVAGIRITARDLPHVEMVDGSPGPPNTGYLINEAFFHPGDGVDIDLRVDDLALPIAGPSISFRDAYRFAERTGARRVIPVHYDSFTADPHRFAEFCDVAKVMVLEDGATAEL